MAIDNTRIKALPIHSTLMLINNFVINTTSFLNQFSETIEKKISSVSSKVTELEIMLAVLEAKLNSVPVGSLVPACRRCYCVVVCVCC